MEISDVIRDRLSVTVDKLEEVRTGILARSVAEAEAELGYDPEEAFTDLEKIHIGVYASIKLCRAALDLYQEDIQEKQADDVRVEHQERIRYLKEKISQLQAEFADINSRLVGDPEVSPPCFDIKKAGDSDE